MLSGASKKDLFGGTCNNLCGLSGMGLVKGWEHQIKSIFWSVTFKVCLSLVQILN
jgi:hypothetical protein